MAKNAVPRKRKWSGLANYNKAKKKAKEMEAKKQAAIRSKSNARCKFCRLIVATVLLATSLHNGHAINCPRWSPVQISAR